MKYLTKDGHGLPHDPFKAIVAPRPIGWISTLSSEGGFNLAPYSYFNAISSDPYLVVFSSEGWKDSATNARDTGEFVCNHVSAANAEIMNETSINAPSTVSEAEFYNLELVESGSVAPPRVKLCSAALECKVTEIFHPKNKDGEEGHNVVVIGEVVEIYIDDAALKDGIFDLEAVKPVTRLGYRDFAHHGVQFEMPRPVWKK